MAEPYPVFAYELLYTLVILENCDPLTNICVSRGSRAKLSYPINSMQM